MKSLTKFTILLTLIFFAVSCGTPFCEEVDCGPNGTCNEELEVCECDPFYEGERCGNEIREKYLGVWNGVDDNTGYEITLNITKGLTVDGVLMQTEELLQNFTFSGSLDNANNIDVPNFMIFFSSTNVYRASIAELDSGSLRFTLEADVVGQPTSSSTFTLTK